MKANTAIWPTLRTLVRGLTAPLLVALVAAASLATTNRTTATDLPATAPVAGVQGQVHYLPFDANHFLALLRGEHGSATDIENPVRLIASLVSALDGNQIAVDHWEDGYDADPIAAPGATTETLLLDEGDTEVFDNWVDTALAGDISPAGGDPYYDGGDRIVSTGAVVVTAGGWPTDATTLHANAAVVPEISGYGFEFVSPVGEDTPFPSGTPTASPWEYTGFLVLASEDDTTVTFPDGATTTLDAGQSDLFDGGVDRGDAVSADKPVLVYLATGDELPTSGYEGRMYRLTPTERWSDDYLTPVGSRNTSNLRSRVFLYNPAGSAIDVTYETSSGSNGTVNVPAGGGANVAVGVDAGTRFSSPGNPFYALEATTTPEGTGFGDTSASYNWGVDLTPTSALTPMVVIGYGPGSEDGTENDSPVWVAPMAAADVYVDLDADPTTGAATDSNGNKYDFRCEGVDAYEPVVIKDIGASSCSSITGYTGSVGSGDADMTGARIYTVDGTPIASAWGQMPGLNQVQPAIDMGTTVLPFPTIDLHKSSEVLDDDGDGKARPGDTVRYTITVTNRGISPVDDLSVNDQVPEHTTYTAGSTVANGSPVADGSTGTPFPLDEGGLPVPPVLAVGEARSVVYDVVVDDPLPPGVTQIENEVTLESDYGTYTDLNLQPVAEPGSIGDRVWDDADGDGTQDGGEGGLVGVELELIDGEGAVLAATTTGANGAYHFDEVYPGTYTVRVRPETLPGDKAATADLDGADTPNEAEVALAAGQDRTDVDFGYTTATFTLAKTVYRGHGGAGCPGGELVSGEAGDGVTYCFEVTNTGAAPLLQVHVDDADLGLDSGDLVLESGNPASLAPGTSVVWSYDAEIAGDLENTASAAARVTPSGPELSVTDTASVDELAPAIDVEKVVYAGHDGGAACGSGVELLQRRAGNPVTYCFTITNTGETDLSAVTVADPDLGLAHGDLEHPLLTPGQSTTLHAEATVDGDLLNTVTARGTSPAGVQVTATDTAAVDEVHPALTIEKSLYAGHDGGASCPGGEDLTARVGGEVTWCFRVTNSGDVVATDVEVDDVPLGVDQDDLTVASGDLSSIPAGGSVDLYLEATVAGLDDEVANVATTSFDPPIGPPVGDDDTASLAVIDPAVDIDKTVYGGHDGGAGCPAGDLHQDELGQPVTWCFVVTNIGDSPLADVTIADPALGVDESDLTVLSGSLASVPAGGSVTLHLEGNLTGDLPNTASVSATPLVGPAVTDQDDAAVEVLVPGIELHKTVYAGDDGGAGCPGGESVVGRAGAEVTWCFEVENTGEVPFETVTVTDDAIGFEDTVEDLAPGATATLHTVGTVDGDRPNTATATGITPGDDEVEDTDGAAVDEIHPAISVEKTVYAGHDGGASCAGAEEVEEELGRPVTWCFAVTNEGDVALTGVTLDDATLGVDEADVTVTQGAPAGLAPGATLLAHAETTVDGTHVNTVTVAGTAPDGGDVTAADTARLTVIGPEVGLAKAVVAPPTGNGDGTYTLTYRLRVANSGDTVLHDVQVTDDLAAAFAGATGFTVDEVRSGDLTVNWPGYTGRPAGSTALLAGTDTLAVGAHGDVEVTVTVDPGDLLGPFFNVGHVTATSPGGEQVTDSSDSGSDADPGATNPLEPGDSGGSDDPVPVEFPPVDLVVTKSVADVQVDGPLGFVEWRIVVANEGAGDDPGPIVVTDELDERLELVSVRGDGWSCRAAGRLVTCTWDAPLPAGGSTSEIRLVTGLRVLADTTVSNTAHVASTRAEADTANNDDGAEAAAEVDASRRVPATLPRTGATVGGMVLLGVGLVLAGRELQRRARASG